MGSRGRMCPQHSDWIREPVSSVWARKRLRVQGVAASVPIGAPSGADRAKQEVDIAEPFLAVDLGLAVFLDREHEIPYLADVGVLHREVELAPFS